MKKLLFILLLSPLFTFAQSKQVEEYCSIITSPKMLSRNVSVSVDFGQDGKESAAKKTIADKISSYTSVVDALNLLAQQGWILVANYQIAIDRGMITMGYLMKRKLE
jgi:hypothetical protein